MSGIPEVFIANEGDLGPRDAYNVTMNLTAGDFHEGDESLHYILVAQNIRKVCLPLIAVVGFLGNTMSMLVFTTRHMRTSSCSVFLAALALVDNLFLVSLLVSWVDGEFYNILTTKTACIALVFSSYATSFLSVWFIVGFSCERYFAICFPLRSSFLCSVFREKVVVFLLSVLSILLYNFGLWTTEVTFAEGSYRCVPKQEFIGFLNIITWVDTFMTMIIPFIIISAMNSKVLCTIVRNFPVTPSTSAKDSAGVYAKERSMRSARGRRCITLRVTKTVLLVSTTFLLLNLPSHIIRLYNLILSTSQSHEAMHFSWKYRFLQEIAQVLYYSTFSCNFIIYTLFGRNFKHSLVMMLRCKSTSETHRRKMLIRLSSTQACSPATSL